MINFIDLYPEVKNKWDTETAENNSLDRFDRSKLDHEELKSKLIKDTETKHGKGTYSVFKCIETYKKFEDKAKYYKTMYEKPMEYDNDATINNIQQSLKVAYQEKMLEWRWKANIVREKYACALKCMKLQEELHDKKDN